MKIKNSRNNQGFAHLFAFVLVLAVVGVIGFAGYSVIKHKANAGGNDTLGTIQTIKGACTTTKAVAATHYTANVTQRKLVKAAVPGKAAVYKTVNVYNAKGKKTGTKRVLVSAAVPAKPAVYQTVIVHKKGDVKTAAVPAKTTCKPDTYVYNGKTYATMAEAQAALAAALAANGANSSASSSVSASCTVTAPTVFSTGLSNKETVTVNVTNTGASAFSVAAPTITGTLSGSTLQFSSSMPSNLTIQPGKLLSWSASSSIPDVSGGVTLPITVSSTAPAFNCSTSTSLYGASDFTAQTLTCTSTSITPSVPVLGGALTYSATVTNNFKIPMTIRPTASISNYGFSLAPSSGTMTTINPGQSAPVSFTTTAGVPTAGANGQPTQLGSGYVGIYGAVASGYGFSATTSASCQLTI